MKKANAKQTLCECYGLLRGKREWLWFRLRKGDETVGSFREQLSEAVEQAQATLSQVLKRVRNPFAKSAIKRSLDDLAMAKDCLVRYWLLGAMMWSALAEREIWTAYKLLRGR